MSLGFGDLLGPRNLKKRKKEKKSEIEKREKSRDVRPVDHECLAGNLEVIKYLNRIFGILVDGRTAWAMTQKIGDIYICILIASIIKIPCD